VADTTARSTALPQEEVPTSAAVLTIELRVCSSADRIPASEPASDDHKQGPPGGVARPEQW
jgi:hypothetical protein